MPELPEAETIARTLNRALAGAAIARVRLGRPDFLKIGSRAALRRLAGRRISAVTRRGKYLLIEIPPARLVLQLGMSGRVYVHQADHPRPAHTHLILALADGRELRCANVRRIAAGVHLLVGDELGPLGKLGPDADAVGRAEFIERLAGRTAPIKAALLNQSILAGVGNIYADEALFRAGVRPTRRVRDISRAALAKLHRAIRTVLARAITAGGSTLRTSTPYADANGELGYFSVSHRVYGRYGQPCPLCRRRLRRTTVAGRTTSYCPGCQK